MLYCGSDWWHCRTLYRFTGMWPDIVGFFFFFFRLMAYSLVYKTFPVCFGFQRRSVIY